MSPKLLRTVSETHRDHNDPLSVVSRARGVLNPFQELELPSILPYASLTNLELRYTTGPGLSEEEIKWIVDSIEVSLKHLYDASHMEWNRQEKWNDMRHEHQRLLVVSHKELGERIAFLSFRWDLEENDPIMYIYELFVEAHARGKQVAIALMRYAEDLCRKQQVYMVMLTVFCGNQAAMSLYRDKLNYVIDEDSPSQYDINDVGYEILSKQLPGF